MLPARTPTPAQHSVRLRRQSEASCRPALGLQGFPDGLDAVAVFVQVALAYAACAPYLDGVAGWREHQLHVIDELRRADRHTAASATALLVCVCVQWNIPSYSVTSSTTSEFAYAGSRGQVLRKHAAVATSCAVQSVLPVSRDGARLLSRHVAS